MEEEIPSQANSPQNLASRAATDTETPTEVSIARNWKDYLTESLLIVFSVVFALVLTEIFNTMHEKQHTREILNAVRTELINNRKAEEEQYRYHLQVLQNIDSALANPVFGSKFISNGVLNMKTVMPDGVLYRDLNDVAWQVAKQDNIFAKVDLSVYSLLTEIYDNQERITKSEQEIANVLFTRESRTASDNRVTLLLLHDNYHGWAVDRVPGLLKNYSKAIDALRKYAE